MLSVNNFTDATNIEVKGGKGADMVNAGNLRVGPGGGGGGGLIWSTQSVLQTNITTANTGGLNGVATAYSNDAWGADRGQNGYNLFNLQLPISNGVFRPNIDSVRIKDLGSCITTNFEGIAYTNTNGIASWQWFLGDGQTETLQNFIYTYNSPGTFSVKLVATDINGCKDSITKNITVTTSALPVVTASKDIEVCVGVPVQLNSTGADTYSWFP